MKSGLDMVQDIFNILNVDEITTVITGNLYMYERPKNSELEDIVVNSLPITGNQFQKGVANVNIHVPNLKGLKIKGKLDDTQPDIERLSGITKIVLPKIADVIGYDYQFSASLPGQPIRDTDLSWYVNIRVEYYSVQTNFTNV